MTDVKHCGDETTHGLHHWFDSDGWHRCSPVPETETNVVSIDADDPAAVSKLVDLFFRCLGPTDPRVGNQDHAMRMALLNFALEAS